MVSSNQRNECEKRARRLRIHTSAITGMHQRPPIVRLIGVSVLREWESFGHANKSDRFFRFESANPTPQ